MTAKASDGLHEISEALSSLLFDMLTRFFRAVLLPRFFVLDEIAFGFLFDLAFMNPTAMMYNIFGVVLFADDLPRVNNH